MGRAVPQPQTKISWARFFMCVDVLGILGKLNQTQHQTQTGAQITPNANPNRPQIGPTSAQHRARNGPGSTPTVPKTGARIDPTSTPNRPKFGPNSAQNRAQTGPESTPNRPPNGRANRPHIDPKSAQVRPELGSKSSPKWPRIDPKSAPNRSNIGLLGGAGGVRRSWGVPGASWRGLGGVLGAS